MRKQEVIKILKNKIPQCKKYKEIIKLKDDILTSYLDFFWEEVFSDFEKELWNANPTRFDNYKANYDNKYYYRIFLNSFGYIDNINFGDIPFNYESLVIESTRVYLEEIKDPRVYLTFEEIEYGGRDNKIVTTTKPIIPEIVSYFLNGYQFIHGKEKSSLKIKDYIKSPVLESIPLKGEKLNKYINLCRKQYLLYEELIKSSIKLKEIMINLSKKEINSKFPELLY